MNYQIDRISFVHLMNVCVIKDIEIFMFNNERKPTFLDNITVTVRQPNDFDNDIDNWGMLVITNYNDRVIAQLNSTTTQKTILYNIELINMGNTTLTEQSIITNKTEFLKELNHYLERQNVGT